MIAGAEAALRSDPAATLLLVGPPDLADALADRADGRVTLVPSGVGLADEDDAVRAVRANRDAPCRVAARLVRDGLADAFVSTGTPRLMHAAASFALGPVPGTTHPALAVTLRRPAGRSCVLIDVGGAAGTQPALLVQHALLGAAYATACLGTERTPRVALLAGSNRPENLDAARRRAFESLSDLSGAGLMDFAGVVTTSILLAGAVTEASLDACVTDGLTGDVLRTALDAGDVPGASGWAGVLLGYRGIGVHAFTADAVARAVALAALAVRRDLLGAVTTASASLVAYRRTSAGLPSELTS